MKIAWRVRDVPISIGGMWDGFEIDGAMRDFKIKRPFELLKGCGRDKDSESGRMAGRSQT